MISVVGSLMLDLTIHVPQLVQPGGVTHGHDLQVACGGRGANQACAVARMGVPVAIIGVTGQDLLGDAMLTALQADGVDTHCVLHRAEGSSGCFISATDPQGQTELLVANGINASLSAEDVQQHAERIRTSQAVIAQLEVPAEAVEAALFIGRQAGVRTFLNAAPTFRYKPFLLPLCDVLTLNEHEASEITGRAVHDAAAAALAATELRAQGAGAVLVTLGEAGVWVDGPGWEGHLPSYPVQAVDTLGAGDTFTGVLAACLCAGLDLREAARFAVAAAALSVTRRGAQPSIPHKAEVEAFITSYLYRLK
ncbi:MAG TPA: ribokinase [Anaerolineae bacterium]